MFFLMVALIAQSAELGPIQKVIQLVDELQAKVIAEGDSSQVAYEEFVDWCGKQALETKHAIEDATESRETLTATIETAEANIEQLNAEISDLTGTISRQEAEYATAKENRQKEHDDFLARDADLGETVSMLTRASAVLEKNLKASKQEAVQEALVKLTSTLTTVVDSSFVSLQDKNLVESLLQKVDDSPKDDIDVSLLQDVKEQPMTSLAQQPQASQVAYEGSSGAILQTLEDLREKAETSRAASQKEEMQTAHAFNMYEQSTKAEIAAQEEQLETAKKRLNKNSETKARAEGEIETVKAALADSQKYLKDTQQECMERASEFEAESAERSEELKTLSEAKKILTADGVDKAEGRLSEIQGNQKPLSFLQTEVKTTSAALNPFPERQLAAASYLRKEGERIQSYVLAQVGNRLAADPFAKVKDMIQAMVEKLLQEQAEESEHKAWCDKETSKTEQSLDVKSDRVDELSTRVDKAKAESAQLAREVQVLYTEIQALDQSVKEATAMRQKEAADFTEKKKDYENGQTACAAAIKVLHEYYQGKSFVQSSALVSDMSHGAASQPGGSASGIIGLLEVAESDFSRMLAEATAAEDSAVSEYETFLQDSKVSRASKEAESKNKAAERQRVQGTIQETGQDHSDAKKELAAVKEYDEKLKESCEAKAPSFEEREQRRKAEIEGLQTALAILDGRDIAMTQLNRGLRR
jgi:hypothetical protein